MVILKEKNRRRYWLIIMPILLAIVLPVITLAQSGDTPRPAPVILTDAQDKYPMGLHLELLEDPTSELTIEDVTSSAYDDQFIPSQAAVPNFGYTTSAIWARFEVRNQASLAAAWRLVVAEGRLEYVDLYLTGPDGTAWAHQQAGRFRPFTVREVPYHYGTFELPFPSDRDQSVYLRFQSGTPLILPLTLWSLEAFSYHAQTELLMHGLFFGVMLAMLSYNLFIFVSLRDRSYLYLSMFIAGYSLTLAFQEGLAQQYLWPQWRQLYGQETTAPLTVVIFLVFAASFLQTKVRTPMLHKVIVAIVILACFSLSSRYLGRPNTLESISILLAIVVVVAAGYVTWRQGYRPARYYLLAWLLFLGILIVYQLTNLGLLFVPLLGPHSLEIGAALMVLLLSLALADRINLLKAGTEQANLALADEIQERKNAQQALGESEKKYRTVVEQATAGILVMQGDRRKYYNPVWLKITGYSTEEYEATPFLSLVYADDLETVEAAYQKLAMGQDFGVIPDFRITTKSGDIKWLSVRGARIEWEGEPAGMAFIKDITERKQMEVELRQHRDRLEELVAERTGQLSAFLDMTMLVSEARILSQVVDVAVDRIMEFCQCQALVLHLLDDDHTTLNLLTQRGLTLAQQEHFQTIPLKVPLSDWLLQRQEPLLALGPDKAAVLPVVLQLDDCKAYIGVQLRAGEQILGMLSYYRFSEETFSVDEVSLLVALAEQLSIIIENHRLRDQIQENAVVAERHRLARDLHDSITQSLYSINLFAHATRQAAEMDDTERLASSIDRVEAISQTALQEMRLLLYQLRPPLLTEKGLAEVLQLRFDSVERRLGIEVDYQVEGSFDLPAEIAEDVYWVAIETLNNSLKHAEASRITVQLIMAAPTIDLKIADNGRGFELDRVQGGMGLPNIRERVEQLDGCLTIKSAPGAGTTTAITVNVANAPDNGR